jgi:hypothetical protein
MLEMGSAHKILVHELEGKNQLWDMNTLIVVFKETGCFERELGLA